MPSSPPEPPGPHDPIAPQRRDPERIGPFRILRRIGEGGMGAVYLAEQEQPRRQVALKVIRVGLRRPEILRRFEAEQQAVARMTHDYVAKVHDAGVTEDGEPYFAMEYVDGEPLVEFCDRRCLPVRARLELFQKICEGVHHAHQKAIIHRDLKPGNILVVEQGGVPIPKVIDFGLAKSLEDPLTDDSMLLTEVGRPMGTPMYMSPEQATGSTDIDTRTDVYALGTVLFHLLSGSAVLDPTRFTSAAQHEIIRAILIEDPERPSERCRTHESSSDGAAMRGTTPDGLRRMLRGDLDRIVLMCLRKEPDRRYPSVAELGEDIEAYLENRPVKATDPSATYLARKFVRRNRGLVSVGAVLAVATIVTLVLVNDARRRAVAASIAKGIAEAEASANLTLANERLAAFERMADVRRLEDRIREAEVDLWPAIPDRVDAMETWIAESEAMVGRLDTHRATLAAMRARALPFDRSPEDHPRYEDLIRIRSERGQAAQHLQELLDRLPPEEPEAVNARRWHDRMVRMEQELEDIVAERFEWSFEDASDQWLHDTLRGLVEGLEEFAGRNDEREGGGVLDEVRVRLELAKSIGPATLDAHREAWDEALASIRNRRECPMYDGLVLEPQVGLVPLGRDPDSGLWEFGFWKQTGRIPERGDDGRLELENESGLVFVLLPGGTFVMGSPPGEPGHDSDEERQEVSLAPFFLSKYEMTQGQWEAAGESNPSAYGPHNYDDWDRLPNGREILLLHPVEQVDYFSCERVLRRLGLVLPTEAQWEYAARAGTETTFWTGDDPASLEEAANLADGFAESYGAPYRRFYDEIDDGFVAHAPVGQLRANPFGLHDVAGNVWEWCRDPFAGYDNPMDPVDGERIVPTFLLDDRVVRGGSYQDWLVSLRSAHRHTENVTLRANTLGLRPARAIDP